MKRGTRLLLLLGCVLPYMCAVLRLVFYHRAHPGALPRWIPLLMMVFLVLTILAGGALLSRAARRHSVDESTEESKLRKSSGKRVLQTGLVLYVLILLNGIRLVVEHSVPWAYAIPGLAMDIFLIAVFGWLLRRLKKTEAGDAAVGKS